MKAKISVITVILLIGIALGSVSAKRVEIDGIDVTLSKSGDYADSTDDLRIDPGEDFYVHIKLENPDENKTNVDVDIEITILGVKVYDDEEDIDRLIEGEDYVIRIRSKDFDAIWDENLMNYECGDKRVNVRVSGDVSKERDYADLDIRGDKLRVSMKPEYPTASDKITIKVTDEDNEELEDIWVKFTNLGDNDEWDEDDKEWDDRTDEDGEVSVILSKLWEFRSDPYGIYQVDVWDEDREYCKKTFRFDAKHTLNISIVTPLNPRVGEPINVQIVDENNRGVNGAKITVNAANFHETYTAKSDGYVSFTINTPGKYELIASKEDYRDSPIKSITVASKSAAGITINPKTQVVGNPVEIIVSDANGSALEGATVTITKPDGTPGPTLETPSSGSVVYTPLSVGTYTVRVEEKEHNPTEDRFSVFYEFKIDSPEESRINRDVTIIVKDQADQPVANASVSIQGTTIRGYTNSSGLFTFRLSEPGDYTLKVEKDKFMDATKEIGIRGLLSLELSSTEIEFGQSVTISVFDDEGNKISADIIVTKPDGVKEMVTTETYIPTSAGNYVVSASKSGYSASSVNLRVNPRPVKLESTIRNKKLIVTVSSRNEPVSGVRLSVKANGIEKEIVTDSKGIASLDLSNMNLTGSISISVESNNYEKKTITQKAKVGIDYSWLVGVVGIVAIIAMIVISLSKRRRRKKEKKGITIKRTKGTRLGKV